MWPEDVAVGVVGGRLDGEEVEHGVERVVLVDDVREVAAKPAKARREPYEERDLVLHLGRHAHRDAVHEEPVFAQRFAVVGDEEHGCAAGGDGREGVDEAVEQVVGVDDAVVVGVDEAGEVFVGLLHVVDDGREHLERLRVFLAVDGAVAGAGVEHDEHLLTVALLDALAESAEQQFVVGGVFVWAMRR